MHRWLHIVAMVPLFAAASGHAQSNLLAARDPAPKAQRPLDFRLTQEPGFDQLTPPTKGFVAGAEIAPNTRIGFHLMTISRPKLGPEWRTDGRSNRSRKPAVSISVRF